MSKIIDTNVPIIANGHESEQATPACQQACLALLQLVFNDEFRLVLDDRCEYDEFPRDEQLTKFDRADHKWVAVALAHNRAYGETAPIAQAVDPKWRDFASVLSEEPSRNVVVKVRA